jgi:hypothetical protein
LFATDEAEAEAETERTKSAREARLDARERLAAIVSDVTSKQTTSRAKEEERGAFRRYSLLLASA